MTLRRLNSAGQRRECDEAALPQLRGGVAINKPLHSIAIPGQRKQLRAEREGERERASKRTGERGEIHGTHLACGTPPCRLRKSPDERITTCAVSTLGPNEHRAAVLQC